MSVALSKFIPWAEKDIEFIRSRRERLQKRVGIVLDQLEKSDTSSLHDMTEQAYELAGCLLACGAEPEEIFNALRLAARAGAYYFDFLLSPKGTEKEIDLGQGTVITLNNNCNLGGGADVFFWEMTFLLCVLCREIELADRVAQVPIDVTRKAARKFDKDYIYLSTKAKQCVWRCEFERARQYFAQALDVLHLENLGSSVSSAKSYGHYSLYFSSLEALMTQNATAFDDALYQLLMRARANDEDSKRDAESLLVTGLIAIAAIAHDQGMVFETRSDYMPDFLVQGTFSTQRAILTPPTTPDPDLSHLDDLQPTPAVRFTTRTLTFPEDDSHISALLANISANEAELKQLNAEIDALDSENDEDLTEDPELKLKRIDRTIALQTSEQVVIQSLYPDHEFYLYPSKVDESVYPRIELQYGRIEFVPIPNVFSQIWRIVSSPTEPAQWLMTTATFESFEKKSIRLDDGRIAEEGSRAYLEQAIKVMCEDEEECISILGAQLQEALQEGRITHKAIHRAYDEATGKLGTVKVMTFQL
jgi:Immunity protein 49